VVDIKKTNAYVQAKQLAGNGQHVSPIYAVSLNKALLSVAFCLVGFSACAGTTHRFECPSTLSDGHQIHALNNASLFDGPPEQMADLTPASGKADRWDLTGIDPYLVCRYRGLDKVVTLGAKGSKAYEATSTPFAAYCG
jgi:hypothetical protein